MSTPSRPPSDGSTRSRRLLPLHLVHPAAKKRRGGPKEIARKPPPNQRRYEAAVAKECQMMVDSDSLVEAVRDRSPSSQVGHEALVRLAKAAASVEFDLGRAVQRGEHQRVGRLGSRSVRILRQAASLTIQQKNNGTDLRGEAMRQVERLFVELVTETATSTLPAELAQKLVERLRRMMVEAWQDKAEADPVR